MVDANGYEVYDLENELVERVTADQEIDALDTRGGDAMTDAHVANFLAAIRTGEALHSPIEEGQRSVLLCHLGNIAQEHGGALQIDARTGHIQDNERASGMWSRRYAPEWKPTV